ncbi:hypothetical protein FOL47_001910, partial [Perkinsus chesapeaki]
MAVAGHALIPSLVASYAITALEPLLRAWSPILCKLHEAFLEEMMKSRVFGGDSASDSCSDITEHNSRAGMGIIMASSECYICRQPVKLIAKLGRRALPRTTSTTSAVSRQVSDMSTDNYPAEVVGPDKLYHLRSRQMGFMEPSESTNCTHLVFNPGDVPAPQLMGTPAVAHEASQLCTVAASSPGVDDSIDLGAPHTEVRAVFVATLDPRGMPRPPPSLPTGAAETVVVGGPSLSVTGGIESRAVCESPPAMMSMPPPRASARIQKSAAAAYLSRAPAASVHLLLDLQSDP